MKEKIVDCIIFNEKLSFLNFRINQSIDLVDIIYVIFNGNQKKSELLSDKFEFKDNSKVKILEYPSTIEDGFSEVGILLLQEKLNFDDIISISYTNELPDFQSYNNLIDILPFYSIVSLQKKYTWSLDYVENKLHKGSKIFYYTNFLKYSTLYSNPLEKKFSETICEFYENGWCFFGFDTPDSYPKSNLLPSGIIDKFKTSLLIKSDEKEKFQNIYHYVGNPIINLRHKKIFYIGDIETQIDFDERMIFQKNKVMSTNSDFNQIYIPNYPIYESSNFELEYFLNEVKKYMSILFLLPHDEVIFNFEFMKEPKKILWGELENSDVLTLLLN